MFRNGGPEVMELLEAERASRGRLFSTRPALFTYVARRAGLGAVAADWFAVAGSGKARSDIRQACQLADAAQARRDLEAGKTTGSSILLP
jgi:NADPH2:quinone reductase